MTRHVMSLVALPLLLLLIIVDAAHAQMPMHHFKYPTTIAQGCALCRGTGNCSQAVDNATSGVYCGDLTRTFQPCCCQFRNECMTTIFSERCDCLSDAEVEQFMSARFTVFCIFTVLFWIVLIWDRMCGRPYKVMNSNRHHALANSPSVARLVDGAPQRETARDQELLEMDHTRSDDDAQDDDDAAIEAALNSQADEPTRNPQARNSGRGDPDDRDTVVVTVQEEDARTSRDRAEEEGSTGAAAAGSIQSV